MPRLFLNTTFVAPILALLWALPAPAQAQSKVALRKVDGRFQLTRNGKPFFIKGAGGETHLAELVQAGGNSIRTWGTDNLDTVLDSAHTNGLTVCVGMWLGHQRHGFDYQNRTDVLKQLDDCLAAVRKYKDHPAVLMWGVGNEMEGDGNDPSVWYAVNHIAREIKKIDPSHPTITVIAELGEGESKLHSIERFCPDVDIVGINSYGGIESVGTRYRKSGLSRPYIVTEHGPLGPWESGKTPWGSPIEATSTEKGTAFEKGYRAAVLEQPGLCLGSYAFLWGHKQETTATWFGMLLPDGTRLAAVDVMREAWTGSPPKNRCPRIVSMKADQTQNLKPGSSVNATISATDPEDDSLRIEWVLRTDSRKIGAGGDAQKGETTIENAVKADGPTATVTLPSRKGSYRLFAYVYDGQGGAAVANVPLHVDDGQAMEITSAPKKDLPFVLYGDDSSQTTYAPSGYMGNTAAVSMELACTETPHTGKTCIKAEYTSTKDWGGVLWQSPANDWDGAKPGGANLMGATALEFWARGKSGGETVNFVFGVLDGHQQYRDTAKGELNNVKLTKEWKRYSFPLKGKDLGRIKTGFGWSLAAQGRPVTFYLDDIRYVAP